MQSQKTSCLICHELGDVLVCCNSTCPIVLHESCMTSSAWFDDSGRFYCPYCFYKQALAEYHCAKEKALLSNRKLASFLGTRTSLNNSMDQKNFKRLKRKKPAVSTIIEEGDDASCTKVGCEGFNQSMQLKGDHQSESCFLEKLYCNQQAGLTRGPYWGKGSDDENLTKYCLVTGKQMEGVLKIEQAQKGHEDVSHLRIKADDVIVINVKPNGIYDRAYQDDGSFIRPMTVDSEVADQSAEIEKYQNPRKEGQSNLISRVKVTYPTSEDSDSKIDKNLDYSIKECGEISKAVEQCYTGPVEEKTQVVFPEDCVFMTKKENTVAKLDGLTEFVCSQLSTVFPAVRRRKLPWTVEEVGMLKEGVQRFLVTTNKNLPWLKIMSFGSHVFDGTRTPADLKDKWKNIKGKGKGKCKF